MVLLDIRISILGAQCARLSFDEQADCRGENEDSTTTNQILSNTTHDVCAYLRLLYIMPSLGSSQQRCMFASIMMRIARQLFWIDLFPSCLLR